MKLGRTQLERTRRPKSGEVLRSTPEVEQPLEIDLQRVVNEVASYGRKGPYRADYETLLGLLGGRQLEQLRPNHKQEANEKFASLNEELLRFQFIDGVAQCKLFDPAAFAGHQWDDQPIRNKINQELALMKVRSGQGWLTALQLIVLFPEEKQRIVRELAPEVSSRLDYVETELVKDPEAVLWEDLVAIKTLFPEKNGRVESIVRRQWPDWHRRVEGSLGRAKTADRLDRKRTFAGAALGLSISMYILAAEKAEMNDQGLMEITPAQKRLVASPALPDRPVV